MEAERWRRAEELYHAALKIDVAQRASFVKEACQGDAELWQEVESLLSYEKSAADFIEMPAFDLAARMMAQSQVGEEKAELAVPSTILNRFRVIEKLGRGGMGVVYKVEDTKLKRNVALKFLPPEFVQDSRSLERFEREAHAASALNHPNICTVYDVDEYQGQPFIAMELLEGQTLASRIEGGPLPTGELLEIAIQICDALEAAHGKSIIHRDIKPSNIFLTGNGQPKVLDFGLAKRQDSDDQDYRAAAAEDLPTSPPPNPDFTLTQTGAALGTAGYMSPEQIRGERLDARSDLFSFGLVLYETATGQRAFKGDTGLELQNAIIGDVPIPARQLNPQQPAALERIIDKALKKDRLKRYQTAGELRADLQALARKLESRRSLRRWVPASAAVLALLIAGAIFLSVRRSQPPALLQIKLRQLTTNSWENSVKSGTISPDGKYLAYLDAQGMHVKDIEGGMTQALAPPEAFKNANVQWECCSWFPDSTRFLANAHPGSEDQMAWASTTTTVWKFSRLGEEPRKLLDKSVAWSVSPDGSQISFGTNNGKLGEREIWLAGPNGEQAHKLYETEEKSAICCLGFLPGGQQVSYISTDEAGDSLMARDFPSGPVTTLVPASETKKMGDFVWLPGGRLLYSDTCSGIFADEACNFWIMRFDTRSGKITEKPRRLTDWFGFPINMPSLTADAKRLAFLRSSPFYGTSYMADLEAGGTRIRNLKHFTLEEADDSVGGWATDSKSVFIFKNRGDHYGIVKRGLNSETEETIVAAASGGFAGQASVSPDGKWILIRIFPLHEGPLAPHPLVRVPTAGGPPELITTVPRFSGIFCAKAPSNLCVLAEPTKNEKRVVVTAFDPIKGRGRELMQYDIGPLPDVEGLLPIDISPDGTRLAVAKHTEGPIEILSLGGERLQIIHAKGLNNIRALGWTSDGKGLFVSSPINRGWEVLHVGFHGDVKVLWTSNEGDESVGWSESADGRHIALYGTKQNASNIWMMENF